MTKDEQRLVDFIAGIAVGLLVGIVCAPRTGAETRTEMRRRTSEGLEYLNQEAAKLREQAGSVVTKTWERIGSKEKPVPPQTALQEAYEDNPSGT